MFDLPEHLAERCRMANSIQELHGHGPIVVAQIILADA